MRKEIKKIGRATGIVLTKEELKVYDLEIGDFIDLGDICKIKKRKTKNGKI